ncbi:MAG: hypothetical protein LBE09_07675 [Christensenellaceae bacterium]|jgi:hypothetical protein|nr:hypothetical protein [Christensenellaceae bacterium]
MDIIEERKENRQYANLSQERLMNELFSVANDARSCGLLENSKLDDFYIRVRPILTEEQAERMRELILQLKR